MSSLTLSPTRALSGEIRLPGSKSISNRCLLLSAMAQGRTRIDNLLRSDDTHRMISALRALGIVIDEVHEHEVEVTGVAGALVKTDAVVALDLGLAGTALRPLTAALTLGRGRFTLDGNARMRQRPLADLVNGLRQLGARIDYLGAEGYPPVEVHGTGLRGGTATMPGNVSSQFLTSILLAAPLAKNPVSIEVVTEQVSKPYLDITLGLMARFGVSATHENYRYFHVAPAPYASPGRLMVEGDASAASYFLAAGAIAGDGITVRGIGSESTQGDVGFLEILRAMGARVRVDRDAVTVQPGGLQAVDRDLNHIPDAAMTVAVLALFATGTTVIRNIHNWRVKETDRLDAMSRELRKLGAAVDEGPDYLAVTPPQRLTPATIDTYDDHRMAMCFSLAALGGIAVTINDPECVAKTFPNYFDEFARLAVR